MPVAPDLLEQVQHLRLHGGIERRCRLIEQQDRRFEDQRPGDGDALTLPARQLVRIAETEARSQSHFVECAQDALFDID